MLWIVLGLIGLGAVLLMLNDSAGTTFGLDNDAFSRLIWLGAFALVIGAGVLRSGRSLGAATRQLGGWVLIVLALIAGYQYRYELQDVASRVTAGLVPGSPLALGEQDGRATVSLDKGAGGHFAPASSSTPARQGHGGHGATTLSDGQDARGRHRRFALTIQCRRHRQRKPRAAAVRVRELSVAIEARDVTVLARPPHVAAEPARHELHRLAVGLRRAWRPHDPARLSFVRPLPRRRAGPAPRRPRATLRDPPPALSHRWTGSAASAAPRAGHGPAQPCDG